MARWKLGNAHYLNVPGNEWMHEETDRETGRRNRKMYTVPQLLDPNNPQDQNYRETGELIVCHEGKGERRDITFVGSPTPEMEPLDEEAEAITASMRHTWENPIDTLPANGGMDDKEKAFMQQMMDSFSKAVAPQQNAAVSAEQFAELQAQVAELMKQNTLLKAEREATPASRRA